MPSSKARMWLVFEKLGDYLHTPDVDLKIALRVYLPRQFGNVEVVAFACSFKHLNV